MSKKSNTRKKKPAPAKRISTEEILAMYEAVLPLLYNNPNNISVASEINRQLYSHIQYDFIHYVMEGEGGQKRFATEMMTWDGFGQNKQKLGISTGPEVEINPDKSFEENIRRNYEQAIEMRLAKQPEPKSFHYYRLESKVYPHIVVGFFRAKEDGKKNAFTREEKRFFDRLAPHIFRLYRTVLTHLQHSETFRYFDSFSKIGSHLASEYDLSDTEAKLLPDILFGFSNEEIAERHFVSLATVKTHVNHILKKTGTKNRADFITKFFTSPENVQL